MKPKKANQQDVDFVAGYNPELDYSYEEKQKELLQKQKEDARPALLKRIAAGLLDFVFGIGIAAGLFTLAYFTIFPSIGYQSSTQFLLDTYETSGLYAKNDDGSRFVPLTEKYNDDVTPEKNYDEPITHFYENNARAVLDNKSQEYINRKLDSGYYYLDESGNCLRKDTVPKDTAKEYLEKEYNLAVDYLFADPNVSHAVAVLTYTMPTTILIVTIISSAIFYIAIPLIDEKRRTLGYMILKLIPVTSDKLTTPSRTSIALRSSMFVIINFISAITIGLFLNGSTFSFIPFLINTVILCFSHSNSGLHDYGTKIIVINESRSNAMSEMKQMLEQGEKKYELPTSER